MSIRNTLGKLAPPFMHYLFKRYYMAKTSASFCKHPVGGLFKIIRWSAYKWLGKDISFTPPDGTQFGSMVDNCSSFIVYFNDYRNRDIQKFMERTLPKGSVFVDAGANIGTYTIRAGQLVGPIGKVIAIEADSITYAYLTKNIATNHLDNVTPVNVTLGDKAGRFKMTYNQSNAGATHVAVAGDVSVEVAMKTLDQVLRELGVSRVDYIKVDVEGFEFPLLTGARETILTNPKIIVQTELNDNHSKR